MSTEAERAIVLPPAGSRVRIVTRELGEMFGDVVAAKLMSGRWPFAIWGSERTFCLEPGDVLELEVIDPPDALVQKMSQKQRTSALEGFRFAAGERRRAGAAPAPKTTKKKKGLGS